MKKLISLFFASAFCFSVNASVDTTANPIKDSVWTPKETTEFITIKDINEKLTEWQDKITFKDYTLVKAALEAVINSAQDRKRKEKAKN